MSLRLRSLLSASLVLTAALAGKADSGVRPASRMVVWAWERPEDLRFLPPGVEIAAQTGFVVILGDTVIARGRRHPLEARPGQVTTTVVHVQIDPRDPPAWSAAQRARAAEAVARLAQRVPARTVQIDFEVPGSGRDMLLDLVHDVRARLPAGTRLAMTALASWCSGERWLARADVDEVVPMLFRMGRDGAVIRAQLDAGRDFATPQCRSALAVSTDAPIPAAPAGRRVYLFNPHSWTPQDFDRARRRIEAWDERARSLG